MFQDTPEELADIALQVLIIVFNYNPYPLYDTQST
jgi:hypothetical protein